MNVRQPEISSLETVGQFRVIESEQMQDGRVQVVDMRGVAGHVETELVGLAISDALFDAAAREPQRESLVVMISTQAAARVRVAFDHRRATEFPAPNDDRIVEQSEPL